jgi:hypothetical protein
MDGNLLSASDSQPKQSSVGAKSCRPKDLYDMIDQLMRGRFGALERVRDPEAHPFEAAQLMEG